MYYAGLCGHEGIIILFILIIIVAYSNDHSAIVRHMLSIGVLIGMNDATSALTDTIRLMLEKSTYNNKHDINIYCH